jgi:hypothetical protein
MIGAAAQICMEDMQFDAEWIKRLSERLIRYECTSSTILEDNA